LALKKSVAGIFPSLEAWLGREKVQGPLLGEVK